MIVIKIIIMMLVLSSFYDIINIQICPVSTSSADLG